MDLKDVFPPAGHVQHLYCDDCGKHLDLAYTDFDENVSGVRIRISGLPVLRCVCGKEFLPDRSRFAIITLHKEALEKDSPAAMSVRRKPNRKYNFTPVPFEYDSDDYEYLPGLWRTHDQGFLTPVFFNKNVLLKYDSLPDYSVEFASTTYGTIYGPSFYISFGINKNGKVVMWLGDIANLPENEQYYLRSENVPSDHSIGSEFYDGQIECIFTKPTKENSLFGLRSQFLQAALKRFKVKLGHLDDEVLSLAGSFNGPVVDTPRETQRVADTLNKIYVESFDNKAIASVLRTVGVDLREGGALKRLEAVLQAVAEGEDVRSIMSPFFTLYDFRIAALHLTSAESAKERVKTVTDRLNLAEGTPLTEIYTAIVDGLSDSYEKMIAIVEAPEGAPTES
jgi:hypothetical protein